MDVIAVRMEQAITDGLPGALCPSPRPEELDRVAGGLRPSAVHLQRFVEPPPQVVFPFFTDDGAALFQVGCPSSAP